MKYLLDTNICIYIANKRPESVRARFESVLPNDIAISVVTLAELVYGAENSGRPELNRRRIEIIRTRLTVLDLTSEITTTYARVRVDLERKGTLVGPYDLLIAAQALHLELILVTNNEREFKRIPGLKIENWVD